MLHQKDPIAFPYSHSGVDISEILVHMFTGKAIGNIVFNCTNCGVSFKGTVHPNLQVYTQLTKRNIQQFKNI